MSKFLLAATLSMLVLAACDKGSGDTPPAKATPVSSLPATFMQQRALLAVTMVEANLGAMQDGGGYQEWTPEKAAEKLVATMNAAETPEAGEPQSHNGQFTYVRDEVTGPWQVVIAVSDEQTGIVVSAYGADVATPLVSKTIAVSRY